MIGKVLHGKRGLVVGIANEHSIAAGCANVFHNAGAELAITYASEKSKPYVTPVIAGLNAPTLMPLDVASDAQMEAVFDRIRFEWGTLDFLLHSIAFCPKEDLHGPVSECSKEGFAMAMDISVHSLIRLSRLAVPLMPNGGSILTMSYGGYHVMA